MSRIIPWVFGFAMGPGLFLTASGSTPQANHECGSGHKNGTATTQ